MIGERRLWSPSPRGRPTIATLTDAQLAQIADKIFVAGDRGTTMLPKPATAGPAVFKTALDPIAIDPDLKEAGIGVIDFTRAAGPDIWLHEPVGNTSFRIGS